MRDESIYDIIVKHMKRSKQHSENHVFEDSRAMLDELMALLNQAKPAPRKSEATPEIQVISAMPWDLDVSRTSITDRDGNIIAMCFETDQMNSILPAQRNAQFIVNCVNGFADMSRQLSALNKNEFQEID